MLARTAILFSKNLLNKRFKVEKKTKAIVLNQKDNVATAIIALEAGTTVVLEKERHAEKVKLVSDIPMGHKFAIADIEKGCAVTKYGESIGESTRQIRRGEHVHVQNLVSQRGNR